MPGLIKRGLRSVVSLTWSPLRGLIVMLSFAWSPQRGVSLIRFHYHSCGLPCVVLLAWSPQRGLLQRGLISVVSLRRSHPHGAPQGLSEQPFGPPSGHHGVSWGAFGRVLRGHQALRTIWGAFGDALGCLWGRLGDPMAPLERPSGTPWGVLGSLWASRGES